MQITNSQIQQRGKVHFVGIGGIGMSALARFMHSRETRVSGSDALVDERLAALENLGMSICEGHSEHHLPADVDRVVITAAVGTDNPEVEEAMRRGIEVVSYARALAEVGMNMPSIAVAGTHGKTTTASMIAFVLQELGVDPAAVIGGHVPQLGGNVLTGQGPAFVMEACEYARSFLELSPMHAVITNVGDDHLDYYGSSDRLRAAFREFAGRIDRAGLLVTCSRVARDLDLRGVVNCRMLTIGAKRRDVRVTNGPAGFILQFPEGTRSRQLKLRLPGDHNVANAAMAAVACHRSYDLPLGDIIDILEHFEGVERRFRVLHDGADFAVVDDYAHHPTEIEATLLAARERFPKRRLIAVFQPHLVERVRRHFAGFLNALAYADDLVLVRDCRVIGRSGQNRDGAQELHEAFRRLSVPCDFCNDVRETAGFLQLRRRRGDVFCIMGAGDVGEVSRELAQES